ncbi:di-heme oxidoredictase family protein [Aquamicrobium sp. LC103]|uniref:di-heme oxidoreductase family protein n=1 Tax=Aquamicrobium sp. LC103 TaxID=1120658 RepID=UPI00063E9AE6|nr:di-heme oxidoredictase family protein [Aquamicrobium sp. LC103]TKT69343.1 c-type cytochrome [Aquamicrobium sp. LC103]
MRARLRPDILFFPALLLGAGLAFASSSQRDDLDAGDAARVARVTKPAASFEASERFETMQGGAATSKKLVNADVFSHPSANLDFADQQRFLLGNGLFRKDWVSSPSSTQASDGLGPLFNARACQSCHFKDGRGHAPIGPGDGALSLLVRVSVPPDAEQAATIASGALAASPDPVYGLQIQDNAVAALPAEGKVRIEYQEIEVPLHGGETASLRKPSLSITDLGYGPLHGEAMLSARVAPPMIGLGLIEAIHVSDILAREDPDDADGDGISGRVHWVRDAKGDKQPGRFGWKAIEPTVMQQTAHAFSGDMGLSTRLAPDHWGECTKAQSACRALPHGAQPHLGAEEVSGDLLDLVSFYASNLAVPARRDTADERVLAGKRVFYESGCASCHAPKYVTRRDAGDPAHRFQLIWPYTDLLLHDMGDGLADDRPEGRASGREWRTPPLWGIGLTKTVNADATFLHDGRARTLLEAILWHDGEARKARERVVEMEKEDRVDLLRFLESL